MPQTLHSPPFHGCLKGFKAPILGDFDLRTPRIGGQGGGSGGNLGLLRGLEFTFLKNLRFFKNVGNDKPRRGEGLGYSLLPEGWAVRESCTSPDSKRSCSDEPQLLRIVLEVAKAAFTGKVGQALGGSRRCCRHSSRVS